MTDHIKQARELGQTHAKNAASWAIDGNTSQEHIRRMVKMFENGDLELDDFLPHCPNLSGEFADDLTPLSLYREITGTDALYSVDEPMIDDLADAYEDGVSETFYTECGRIYRAALDTETS